MHLQQYKHYDPHLFLGLHPMGSDSKVVRVFRPGASELYLNLEGNPLPMKHVIGGLFDAAVPLTTSGADYTIYHPSGLEAHDPYAFAPSLGEIDLYLFGNGVHYRAFEALGAHRIVHQGIKGVRFAVWAPSARTVSLVADFNHWDGRLNPMRVLGQSGIWELFVPGIELGERYKFEIKTRDGALKLKTDPYAFQMELRPKTASVVASVDRFGWSDQTWIEKRQNEASRSKPINIYELHAPTWRAPYGRWLNYKELGAQLAEYCLELGYTHVEFLPVQEHPLDESWGYQVSGFYAVTSRQGSCEEFQWMVNHLHEKGIGVILDWVPGHFLTDDFSLARFDGTALYEHEDVRQGYHPHWHTLIFNLGRKEVSNYLIANALFWFEKMHVDGLRVDAVASMLYLDYGREAGEWVPNKYGGKENLETIEFFKHLNSIIHQHYPGVLMVAEESTAFPGVSHSVQNGGLGFDMKWNMGWMNDTLRYFKTDPLYRKHHHQDLTFGLLYAFSERFALALSHDEVVHGKKSLLAKMPGDPWQQFANLRLLLSYQTCQPGKKLLFMGAEIGQWNEWSCKGELDWVLLSFPVHQGIQRLVKELNHFYLTTPPLWEDDFSFQGFEWVDFSDLNNSVIAYWRKGPSGRVLCVHHFTPTFEPYYRLRLHQQGRLKEIFNSDEEKYGGSGKVNRSLHQDTEGITFQLAPLATQIFGYEQS
jgi:1,4-alpha-glucan branching enzyme